MDDFPNFCAACRCIGHAVGECRPIVVGLVSALLPQNVKPPVEVSPNPVVPITVNPVVPYVLPAVQGLGCNTGIIEEDVSVLPPVIELGSPVPNSPSPLPVILLNNVIFVDEVIADGSTVKLYEDIVAGLLPSNQAIRTCASAGGCLGYAVNSGPVVDVASVPCFLNGTQVLCVSVHASGDLSPESRLPDSPVILNKNSSPSTLPGFVGPADVGVDAVVPSVCMDFEGDLPTVVGLVN
ncbi:hypothetical protein MA16_Dca015071 [Dendrobium catenatum]|uniref:Uncharacterized protein n=1 Tax=Dendrobium catenatum TaxID=906689 RepID=A0A2I0VMB1_9ASPA|nr:hypothetical protein MA16_Dca015071 [Dendrobium catenatum]